MQIAILAICKPDQAVLMQFVKKALEESHISSEIHLFSSGDELAAAHVQHPYQLIFIDLDLPDQAGLKAARTVRMTHPQSVIVFLSARDPFYSEVLSVHAFDCLRKPVGYERVVRLMTDIETHILFFHPQIELHYGTNCLRLLLEEIRYVTSAANYCDIQASSPYHLRIPFRDLTDQLQDPRFLQINRGVLINMDHVAAMDQTECRMLDSRILLINQRRAADLVRIYHNYLSQHTTWVTL